MLMSALTFTAALALLAPFLPTTASEPLATFHSYPYTYSNLSPLVTYHPADAWTHNVWGSNTTSPDAWFTFEALGWSLIVNGNRTGGAKWDAHPEYEELPPTLRPLMGTGLDTGRALLYVHVLQRDLHRRTIRLENTRGNMSVAQVQQIAPLPGMSDRREDVTREAGIIDDSINPFFSRDPTNAWAIANASAVTETARVQSYNLGPSLGNNSSIPSFWAARDFDPAFPTNSTLSTTTADSPLSFDVPSGTSLLQWYGAVGPEYGRFELVINPAGSEDDSNFPFSDAEYTGSAERPVDSGRELMMLAYLDPRVSYKAEIRLVEEGKRLDVDGLFFTSFIGNPSLLGSGDFVTEFNEYTSGGNRIMSGSVTAVASLIAVAFALIV